MPRAKTSKPRAKSSSSSDDDILIASESGVIDVDGEAFPIRRGVTRIRASHPAAKQCPGFFEKIDVHYDVERATAAPGEKRTG